MNQRGFEEYTYFVYGRRNGTSNSYIRAIMILDRIFSIDDVFGLNNKTLTEIDDEYLLQRIAEFVKVEEKKFRENKESIFDLGLDSQRSYPKKGFCSAAMRHLQRYQTYEPMEIQANTIAESLTTGKDVSKALIQHFDISKEGKDQVTVSKVRVGQAYYRKMIVSIYGGKCCITGLDIPKLLRASHIVGWAEDIENRMNPENGLCLSGTYDLAFDQHLISFDENYRMIIGKEIHDHFTNDVAKNYFQKLEGKKLTMPSKYLPSQSLLEIHRGQLR